MPFFSVYVFEVLYKMVTLFETNTGSVLRTALRVKTQ